MPRANLHFHPRCFVRTKQRNRPFLQLFTEQSDGRMWPFASSSKERMNEAGGPDHRCLHHCGIHPSLAGPVCPRPIPFPSPAAPPRVGLAWAQHGSPSFPPTSLRGPRSHSAEEEAINLAAPLLPHSTHTVLAPSFFPPTIDHLTATALPSRSKTTF